MGIFFPMTEREAFIVSSIELTRMDGALSPEEMNSCLEVLKKLGYSDEEFERVEDKLDEYSAGSDSIDESEIEFINYFHRPSSWL